MVISFTHTTPIDWLLPGVAPTGKPVEMAVAVIVGFKDGKISHEHIYWDQASVLVQIGLLDPALLPVAGVAPTGKYVEIPLVAIVRFRGDKLYNEHIYWDQASVLVQIGLLDPAAFPVAGVATAKKLVDEALPSNTLMARWAESAPKAPK